MSCREISRWVLRHGTAEIPSAWREHIALCTKCQTVVRQVGALDDLIAGAPAADPGEAYWATFAPRVARRIEATPAPSEHRAPRPSWIRVWVPAVGVAALAFLIGRELYLGQQPSTVSETSIPIVRADKTAPPDAGANPATEPAETATQPRAVTGGERPQVRENRVAGGNTASAPSLSSPAGEGSRNLPNVRPSTVPPPNPSIAGEIPRPEDLNSPPANASAAPAPAAINPRDEERVWPNRQVAIVGEIRPDTHQQASADDKRLAEQRPHALIERGLVDGAPGAETVATGMTPTVRFEAAPGNIMAGSPDSQSPAEAMRRFDRLHELRRQITILQSIAPAMRTAEQNREMCTLWYQVGQITSDSLLIDSAIQNLGTCIKALDASESAEWKRRSDELFDRRSPLPR